MAISINIDGNNYEINGLDHPAEEETAKKLLAEITKHTKNNKDAHAKLLKAFTDQLTNVTKEIKAAAKAPINAGPAPAAATTNTTTTRAARDAAAQTNNLSRSSGNAAKGTDGLATSAGFANNAVKSMTQSVAGAGSMLGTVGKVVSTVFNGLVAAGGFLITTFLSVASASLGAFMKAAAIQGELSKQGMRFANSLSGMQGMAIGASMTMEDLADVVKNNSSTMARFGQGTKLGQTRFIEMAAAAREGANSLRGLGFSAKDEMQVRADYIAILQEGGNVEYARNMSGAEVAKRSTAMAKGFLGLAAATGQTVDQLMKATRDMAADPDLALTLEGLGLSPDVKERVAANFASLEKLGMGSLKDLFVQVQTYGAGISDQAMEFQTLGLGARFEDFTKRLGSIRPEDLQLELMKMGKTINAQQLGMLVQQAGISGPTKAMLVNLKKYASMSEDDIKAQVKAAEQSNAQVKQQQELNDRLTAVKGMFNNVLLKIAESEGFQKGLTALTNALITYGPMIADLLTKVGVTIFNFVGKLFTSEGRQDIINLMYTGFSELMIGLKKTVLGSFYSPEAEAADRALTENANARRMGLAKDNELQKLEADVMKKRMARLLVREDDKNPGATAKADAELALAKSKRDAREKALLEDPTGEAGKAAILEKQSEQTKKAADGMFSSNEKLGLAALGLVAGLIAARALIVKGIELAVLGTGTGAAGMFGKLFGADKAVPAGAKQGADGKWRDAAGKFTKAPAPAQLPTTAKGVGMGMMADMGKQLTQAMGWVLKAGAIAGAMYMIGKALPTLAEGVKSFDDVNWEDMGKAGVSIAGVSAALFALGKIPIGAILQGLAGAAAVSGVMVLLGFGFNKLTPELMAFQALDWETIAKAGVALVGLMAIGAVAGTFFAPLLIGAGVLGALGLALRAFPIDVLEALGKLFEAVGATIGGVVTKMAEGVGLIVDKFTALRNSGIDATTQQIRSLSDIPSEKIRATAVAIAELKTALDGFGGGFWENVGRGITSLFGGDQASQVERMAAAMERYKKSVSVLTETSSGDFVLKPIDIGLYTQLQQTLDETKKKIDTTFSKKTYEETFVATTKAIDGTYNVKTSKLDSTLEQTREAIKKTFTPPYNELKILTQAIKDAVSNASSGLTSPSSPSGPVNMSQGSWLKAVMGYFGGSNRVLTGGPTQKDIQGYIDHVSTKEGNDNSVNPSTYAMGKIQLMPSVVRDLASKLGGSSAGLASIDDKQSLAEAWKKLSPAEKQRFYEAYARNNYNTIKSGIGRDLSEAEWYAGQFGTGNLTNAIKNPNASLTPQQLAAYQANIPAFNKGAAASGQNGLLARIGSNFTSNPGYNVTDASTGTSGGTLATGKGFNQLYLNEQGKLMRGDSEVDSKKAVGDTLTAVSNEGDTQGKILNLLEQTYNLHVEGYNNNKRNERFKGFTAGL